MALLFLDSFDHYENSQSTRKWTFGTVGIVPARTNNGGVVGPVIFPSKTLNNQYATLRAGVAYNTQAFGNSIIRMSNANNVRVPLTELAHIGDGRIRVQVPGASSVVLDFVMNITEWYYFELYSELTTSGTFSAVNYEVHVNNEELATGTLVSNLLHASTSLVYANVGFQGPGGGLSAFIDDLYITDGERLGDIRIYVIRPDGDTADNDWIPEPTDDNYTRIYDITPDDDATIIYTENIGDKNYSTMEDITGFEGEIMGIQAVWCVAKSDGGEATFDALLRSEAVEEDCGEFYPSYPNYLYFLAPFRDSPFTSTSWTIEEINGIQQGIERTS